MELDIATKEERRIGSSSSDEAEPAVSNDGTRVLFTSERYGRRDLFLLELDTGVTLLVAEGQFFTPAWSSDDQRIVVVREDAESSVIETRSMGGDVLTRVIEPSRRVRYPHLGSDGRPGFIAYDDTGPSLAGDGLEDAGVPADQLFVTALAKETIAVLFDR